MITYNKSFNFANISKFYKLKMVTILFTVDLSKCKQTIDGVKVKCPKYTQEEINLLNSYYVRYFYFIIFCT